AVVLTLLLGTSAFCIAESGKDMRDRVTQKAFVTIWYEQALWAYQHKLMSLNDFEMMEGWWSLLRSWLRPHRGISHEHLPLSLGFFAFIHHVRRRGKALLGALLELLLM